MNIVNRFPALRKTALIIAYSNGMINRECSESEWLASLDPLLGADGVYEADLADMDAFLAALPDAELETLADGDEVDMGVLMSLCNKAEILSGLLEDIFNNE